MVVFVGTGSGTFFFIRDNTRGVGGLWGCFEETRKWHILVARVNLEEIISCLKQKTEAGGCWSSEDNSGCVIFVFLPVCVWWWWNPMGREMELQ